MDEPQNNLYEISWNDDTLMINTRESKRITQVVIKGNHLENPISFKLPKMPNQEEIISKDASLSVENPNLGLTGPNGLINSSDTNSGIIINSQFIDGGMGDIGQQWRDVKLYKSTVINNHTSINLTLSGNNGSVLLDKNLFALDQSNQDK